MSLIDPRAIIDPTAILADDVEVGPWSIIGAGVEIGEGTVIGPHVILKGPTRIGKHNRIYQFSSVGEDTPDLKYKGEETRLVIGDHNIKLSAGDLGEMVMASAMLTEHGIEAVRDFSEGVYAPNGLDGCIG